MPSSADSMPPLISSGPELWETGLIHRVQMPDGPGPYPTVVMLHGRYGNDEVMWVFRRTIPRPWLVVAPRAPLPERGGYSWLLSRPESPWPSLADFEEPVAQLRRFIDALPRLYNADPDRVYLMGFSQGAALSLAAALRGAVRPRAIAGLVGFAPVVEPAAVAGALAGLPVFLAAGTEDELVPLALARHTADVVGVAGAELMYQEYPTGHKLTADGLRDLQAWWQER